MRKKLNPHEKMDLQEQARQARDAEWEAEEEELNLQLRRGEIDDDTYWNWLEENPRPSAVIADAVMERKRYKRRSKKNITNNIKVLDREALYDVRQQVGTTIEWSSDFNEGSLVETRDGDIGMVLQQWDPTQNRVAKPKHIKTVLMDSYVRLLVNGKEEWHTKVSVSAPEDN